MINKFKLDSTKSVENKIAISRTLEIASNYAGELSIEVLPLEKVELDPDNKRDLLLTLDDAINGIDKDDPNIDRKKQDLKSLESLANSIRDGQLINPIFVYRYGNKCRLIAGERRTLASAIAGKKEVIARITSQRPIGSKLRILQWVENNERSDLTLSGKVASLEAIIEEYFSENKEVERGHVTSRLLSELTGMTESQARRYTLIFQCNPEIRQAINEGKLEKIKLIELLCSVEDPKHQKQLLGAAISGNSYEVILKLKKELETDQRKKNETRGRKKTNINLGRFKPNVVKIIMSSLVSNNILEMDLTKQMEEIFSCVQWDNNKSIEKGFKKITSLLEERA